MKICDIYQIINTINNKKTKLTEEQAKRIVKIKDKTHQEIANLYGVSRSVITGMKNGTNWSLITNINRGDI